MSNVTLKVNGKSHTVDVDPATPLLYILRNDLDLHGPHFGCGLGQCGACTVLIDGEAVRSCLTLAVQAANKSVVTVEGLSSDDELTPLQKAFRKHFGVGPTRFITELKLDEARRRIMANPRVPLAELATSLGFPHYGRFAARYSLRFGESPGVAKNRWVS